MKWRETEEEYFIMVWAGVGGDSFARVFPRIGSRHVRVIVNLLVLHVRGQIGWWHVGWHVGFACDLSNVLDACVKKLN